MVPMEADLRRVAAVAANYRKQVHAARRGEHRAALAQMDNLGLFGWQLAHRPSHVQTMQALELLALEGDESFALVACMHWLGVALVASPLVTNKELQQRLLGEFGRAQVCAAVSERDTYAGNVESAEPQTDARRADGGYWLNGYKMFVTGVTTAKYVVATARDTQAGESLVVVIPMPTKPDDKSVVIDHTWDPIGARATRTESLQLNGVWVPDDMVLMKLPRFVPAFLMAGIVAFGYYTMPTVATAMKALDLAAARVRSDEQRQFIADCYLHTKQARGLLMDAAMTYDEAVMALPQHQPPLNFLALKALLEAKQYACVAADKTVTLLLSLGLHASRSAMSERVDDLTLALHNLLVIRNMPPNAAECKRLQDEDTLAALLGLPPEQ